MVTTIETLTNPRDYANTSKNLEFTFYDKDKDIVYKITVPDAELNDVVRVRIQTKDDVLKVPKKPGNYWILTDEPIAHCFNAGTPPPTISEEGEVGELRVVYNGEADNLYSRAVNHIFRTPTGNSSGSRSGISVDILCEDDPASHVKLAWMQEKTTKKLPKYFNAATQPKTIEELMEQMTLSEVEKEFMKDRKVLYFKNGINAGDEKHRDYLWIFAYIEVQSNLLRHYIEREWRKKYGAPILCSYMEGR